jgi:hypothetical protein
MRRDGQSILLLGVALLPGITVALGALVVVPQYQQLFADFGTDLPATSRLLLATFRWWSIAPLLTLALWFVWPSAASRGTAAVVFGTISAAALFGFGCYGCYAPIFALTDKI